MFTIVNRQQQTALIREQKAQNVGKYLLHWNGVVASHQETTSYKTQIFLVAAANLRSVGS